MFLVERRQYSIFEFMKAFFMQCNKSNKSMVLYFEVRLGVVQSAEYKHPRVAGGGVCVKSVAIIAVLLLVTGVA